MTAFVASFERRHLVAGTLKFLRENLIVVVDFHAVDILDVGGASPRRHQPVGRGAAIFV